MKTSFLATLCALAMSTQAFANVSAKNYYPRDYESSRERFRAYGSALEARHPALESRAIPVGDEGLTIDTLYLPAKSRTRSLIILTSGNHGPEAYAGSALQSLFVEEILGSLDLTDTGVLLVHALNPWGFKHHRRGTENNVNLNRNFDVDRRLFQTGNAEYDRLREFLEPSREVRRASEFPAKDLLVEMIAKKNVTQQSLTEAIGKGQYRSKEGLNFGGHDFEPQTPVVTDLLARVARPYRAIFHIDLHTGLGKKGVLHVMTKAEMNAVSANAARRLFAAETERDRYEVTPPEAEGFYEILGDYANIIGKRLPESDRIIIPVTAEFGTVGNGLGGKTRTINRLVLENQGHFHGYSDEKAKARVESRFLELFFPSNVRWRNQVIEKGRYFLETVVGRFIAQNP